MMETDGMQLSADPTRAWPGAAFNSADRATHGSGATNESSELEAGASVLRLMH